MTRNAPLFQGCVDAGALVEGAWGGEPVPGLAARPGDHLVRKARMRAREGTPLARIPKAAGCDALIVTGAWTDLSIAPRARTGADKSDVLAVPDDGCSTMNADWHRASIDHAMQNVALVTTVGAVIAALGRGVHDRAGSPLAASAAGGCIGAG